MNFQASGFCHASHKGDNRTFAIGSGNMDRWRQAMMRIA
jgi:hypothetical protein